MKKPWLDADRLVFAGKTCLVASILMGTILVFRASYAPVLPATLASLAAPTSVPRPTLPSSTKPDQLVTPEYDQLNTLQLNMELGAVHHQANAFCLRMTNNKKYLLSHASLLTKTDWQEVTRITMSGRGNAVPLEVNTKPLYLGPMTEDHQANLLHNPDFGQDLVAWPMPSLSTQSGLVLSTIEAQQGDHAWIIGITDRQTHAQSHCLCKVLESSNNSLTIQQIDRIPLDLLIGLPVINQQGHVIGTVLGGSDLHLVGASAQALRRQLISLHEK
jgi:hypothetical protein